MKELLPLSPGNSSPGNSSPGYTSSGLLVSVKNLAEAEMICSCGVDIIDLKNPENGSLGRAETAVILQFLERFGADHSLSFALGELVDADESTETLILEKMKLCHGVLRQKPFVKYGLSKLVSPLDFVTNPHAGVCTGTVRWQDRLLSKFQFWQDYSEPVLVGYADHLVANSPALPEVVRFACESPFRVVLIDTWKKGGGRSLLDLVKIDRLRSWIDLLHQNNIRIALAGSLTLAQIRELWPLQLDWFALRGALCQSEQRNNQLDPQKVRELVQHLQLLKSSQNFS